MRLRNEEMRNDCRSNTWSKCCFSLSDLQPATGGVLKGWKEKREEEERRQRCGSIKVIVSGDGSDCQRHNQQWRRQAPSKQTHTHRDKQIQRGRCLHHIVKGPRCDRDSFCTNSLLPKAHTCRGSSNPSKPDDRLQLMTAPTEKSAWVKNSGGNTHCVRKTYSAKGSFSFFLGWEILRLEPLHFLAEPQSQQYRLQCQKSMNAKIILAPLLQLRAKHMGLRLNNTPYAMKEISSNMWPAAAQMCHNIGCPENLKQNWPLVEAGAV